jgi:hypothetical protein
MLSAFSTARSRKRTFVFLAFCVLLALAAAAVGIDDNPPGLLLAFLSGATLTLSFTHAWRETSAFRALMWVAGLGLLVFGFLHNAFHAFASMAGDSGFFHDLLSGAGVAFFFVALLLCPPAFLVGAVGCIVMSRRERRA